MPEKFSGNYDMIKFSRSISLNGVHGLFYYFIDYFFIVIDQIGKFAFKVRNECGSDQVVIFYYFA